MKKRFSLLLLATELVLLAACYPPSAPTPRPIPVVSAVATRTVAPTATATFTPSPGPTPSATPRPTSTPLPTLAPSPTPVVDQAVAADGTCLPVNDSVPASPDLLEPTYFEDDLLAYLNDGGSISALQRALASQDPEPEPLLWQIVSQDVTADGIPEIFVAVTKSYHVDGDGESHLFAFTCARRQYQSVLLFRRAGAGYRRIGLYSGGGARILMLRDLNGTGVPEVFFGVTWPGYTEVYLLEWDGRQFASLIEYGDPIMLEKYYWLEVSHGQLEVIDTDGDGIFEVVLTYLLPDDEPENTTRRAQTITWAWNGALYSITSAEHTPPRYRFQAIYDGDLAFEQGFYEEAIGFYTQVITDATLLGWDSEYDVYSAELPEPDPQEWPRLTAYAYYRMMLAYARLGNGPEAQRMYGILLSEFPEGAIGRTYADLAESFWQAYTARGRQDVVAGCAAVLALAAADEQALLTPLRSTHNGFYANARLYCDGLYMRCIPTYTTQSLCPFAGP